MEHEDGDRGNSQLADLGAEAADGLTGPELEEITVPP